MPTFGENLRQLRVSRGYSQDKFARMIGSNQVNVSAWEIGSRTPSLATIRHIAETFHVPLSSLISVGDTGMEDDIISEVAETIRNNPTFRLLFDRTRRMSQKDLSVVLSVVEAISKERVEEND